MPHRSNDKPRRRKHCSLWRGHSNHQPRGRTQLRCLHGVKPHAYQEAQRGAAAVGSARHATPLPALRYPSTTTS